LQEALDELKKNKGSIVNISSIAAVQAARNPNFMWCAFGQGACDLASLMWSPLLLPCLLSAGEAAALPVYHCPPGCVANAVTVLARFKKFHSCLVFPPPPPLQLQCGQGWTGYGE